MASGMSRKSRLFNLINSEVEATLNTGRVIRGTFVAYDKDLNIVLGDAVESRTKKWKTGSEEVSRDLGLILLRGENVTHLVVTQGLTGKPPASYQEAKTNLCLKGEGSGVAAGRALPMRPRGPPPMAAGRGLPAAALGNTAGAPLRPQAPLPPNMPMPSGFMPPPGLQQGMPVPPPGAMPPGFQPPPGMPFPGAPAGAAGVPVPPSMPPMPGMPMPPGVMPGQFPGMPPPGMPGFMPPVGPPGGIPIPHAAGGVQPPPPMPFYPGQMPPPPPPQ